jgi:hypothetical protein
MHRVERVDSADKRLWWWGYFHFTRRTFYLFGRVPVWFTEFEVEERPITELIRRAVGS